LLSIDGTSNIINEEQIALYYYDLFKVLEISNLAIVPLNQIYLLILFIFYFFIIKQDNEFGNNCYRKFSIK